MELVLHTGSVLQQYVFVMSKESTDKIVGTLFDSAKTYYQPDFTKMNIGKFDLYASTFFRFVDFFWKETIVDLNRIERKFRIQIPRHETDFIGDYKIFNPLTKNFYSLEFFQIALCAVFDLYSEYEKNNIQAAFSKMFHEEYSHSFANPLTQLMNELNQVTAFESDVEEVDWDGNTLEQTEEHVVLEKIISFLEYCKSFTCFSSYECAIFEDMGRRKMLYPQFCVGY